MSDELRSLVIEVELAAVGRVRVVREHSFDYDAKIIRETIDSAFQSLVTAYRDKEKV